MDNSLLKNYKILFSLLFFVLIFVFFYKVHPIVPYDGDDWGNLSYFRLPLPFGNPNNPIKVLPETLLPLCGQFAAFVVYPFTHDYLQSIQLVTTAIVCCFVAAYVYLFMLLAEKLFRAPVITLLATLFFVLSNFLVFKNQASNNVYLFFSPSLTCFFHYVIPNVLNASLAMNLLCKFDFATCSMDNRHFPNTLFVFTVYLALFSSILSSIVLSACVLSIVLVCGKKQLRHNWPLLLLLAVWGLSLVMEANGNRAHEVGASMANLAIVPTVQTLLAYLQHFNVHWLILFAASFVLALFACWAKKDALRQSKVLTIILLGSALVSTCYLILVCAKAGANRIGRVDVVFAIVFYLVVLASLAFGKACKDIPAVRLVSCLVLLFMLVRVANEKDYRNINGFPQADTGMAISSLLVDTIVAADRNGERSLALPVPKGDNRDNWPHPFRLGDILARTLKMHGVIRHDMKITLVPDATLNKKYLEH